MAVRASVLRRTQFYLSWSARPLQRETPRISPQVSTRFCLHECLHYRIWCTFYDAINISWYSGGQAVQLQWSELFVERCASFQKELFSPSIGRARGPANADQLHLTTSNMVNFKITYLKQQNKRAS